MDRVRSRCKNITQLVHTGLSIKSCRYIYHFLVHRGLLYLSLFIAHFSVENVNVLHCCITYMSYGIPTIMFFKDRKSVV